MKRIKINKILEKKIKNDFKDWTTFIEELLLNIMNQNAGDEKFWKFIFCCWVSIQKAKVLKKELYTTLVLHQIKMAFIMGYPEISFDNNYNLEMKEVKVYS